MRVSDLLRWRGVVRVVVLRADGTCEEAVIRNTITDAGRNLLRDVLSGAVADGEIKYLALGSSNAPPSTADTKLGAEFFRKQITRQEATGTGVLETTVYIAPFEATQQIEEIGWFAGPDASEAPNSGVLVARVLYSRLKTQLESLQIVRQDSIL